MSTLYLVDIFGNPLSTARIIDVRSGPEILMNGHFVVRVPDYISVVNPDNIIDLVNKKHLGMLGFYAGYANITFDDLGDTTDVDLTAPSVGGVFGDRNIISILPGQRFQSLMTPLSGPAPSQAVITWETYSVGVSDIKTTRLAATYVEEPSSSTNFLCSVSFDNGAHFYPALDGGLTNIPLIGQGTQFIIRLTNNTGLAPRSLRVGAWAVLY